MIYSIITVRAHKRFNDLLESDGKCYRLSKPDTWYGPEDLYYVLRRTNESTPSNPFYEIIQAFE